MSTYKPDRWSTQDEVAFCRSALERRGLDWLLKYKEGLDLRTEWGAIDPDVLREQLNFMIICKRFDMQMEVAQGQ